MRGGAMELGDEVPIEKEINLAANFTPSVDDVRFMMLASSFAAMLIIGNVDKVAELREHILNFGSRSGYTEQDMKRIIANLRNMLVISGYPVD